MKEKKKPKKPPRKKDEEKSSKAKKNEDEKRKRENSETKCRYCGRKQRHVRRTECPAFGQTCSKCQKKGHFASVCISSKKVHQLEDINDSSSDESCLRVETISLVQTKSRQWFADITFFNSAQEDFSTTLACQLDTGATCNVLCLDDLSAITQLGDPPMKNSSVKLKLFGGSTMKPTGECDLHIKHNGTKHVLKFQVIQDKCKPLLSAETCEKLQLIQLNASVMDSVHQLNDSLVPEPLSKEEVMSKFPGPAQQDFEWGGLKRKPDFFLWGWGGGEHATLGKLGF